MKKTLPFLLLGLLLFSCKTLSTVSYSAINPMIEWNADIYNGKVKSSQTIVIKQMPTSDGENLYFDDSTRIRTYSIRNDKFDANGRLIEGQTTSWFLPEELETFSLFLEYNKEGGLILITEINRTKSDTTYTTTTITYNSNGLKEKEEEKGNDYTSTKQYTYNNNGTISSINVEVKTNTYLRTEREEWFYKKKLLAGKKTSNKYDDLEESSTQQYTYDKFGRLIRATIDHKDSYFKSQNTTITIVYDYDSNNNIISCESYSIAKRGLDEFGGPDYSYKLTYDEHNNWIKKIYTFGTNNFRYIYNREIEYY